MYGFNINILTNTSWLSQAPIVLLMLAFVQLRRTRPGMDRPFKVWGGTAFAVLLVIPPTVLTCVQAYYTMADPEVCVLSAAQCMQASLHTV